MANGEKAGKIIGFYVKVIMKGQYNLLFEFGIARNCPSSTQSTFDNKDYPAVQEWLYRFAVKHLYTCQGRSKEFLKYEYEIAFPLR